MRAQALETFQKKDTKKDTEKNQKENTHSLRTTAHISASVPHPVSLSIWILIESY